MEPPVAVVRAFVAAVSAADVPAIVALMTADHRFIDATGAVHAGRDRMTDAWKQYFAMFPDYHIEIEDAVSQDNVVAAFGWASGSFHGEPGKSWKFPAAFRCALREGRVAEWRVWADIEPMLHSAGMRRF